MWAALTRWFKRGMGQTTTISNHVKPCLQPSTVLTEPDPSKPPLDPLSVLPSTVTSHSIDAPDGKAKEPSSNSTLPVKTDEDLLPKEPQSCSVTKPGMDTTSETFRDGAVDDSDGSLFLHDNAQREDRRHDHIDASLESPIQMRGKEVFAKDTFTLRDLNADRSKVLGIRSHAQEQAWNLQQLYKTFSDIVRPTISRPKEDITSATDPGLALTKEQLDSISSLLDRMEVSWKAFDRSQEQLSTLEWEIKEKEKQLYTGKKVISVPLVLDEQPSQHPSELSSVPLPLSSRYEESVPDGNSHEQLSYSYQQASAPIAPGLNLRYLLTKAANERLRRLSKDGDPEEWKYAGAQFADLPEHKSLESSSQDDMPLMMSLQVKTFDNVLVGPQDFQDLLLNYGELIACDVPISNTPSLVRKPHHDSSEVTQASLASFRLRELDPPYPRGSLSVSIAADFDGPAGLDETIQPSYQVSNEVLSSEAASPKAASLPSEAANNLLFDPADNQLNADKSVELDSYTFTSSNDTHVDTNRLNVAIKDSSFD